MVHFAPGAAHILARHSPEIEELDRIADEIATLAAHVHAATYRLLVLLAEFDERGGWAGGGFRSCAHWLSWRTGIAAGAAREKVRSARALRELPRVSEAMSRGELSFAKVRAITRVATPENESDLLEVARAGTAAHVERIVRAWRRADDLEEKMAEGKRHESRSLSLYIDDDGMYVVRGRLDPEAGALLEKALETAGDVLVARNSAGGRRTSGAAPECAAQRRADAIALVAECALSNSVNTGNGRPVEVVVHVETESLQEGSGRGQAVIAGGARVSAETSRRLACDAGRVLMTHDQSGNTLTVGRRTRTVPTPIRRALEHRDRTCRFPGCDLRYCDAHHIVHWADGGATDLDNLVLLCRRHHRAVHEEGVRIMRTAGNGLGFQRPDGRRIPDVPSSPPLETELTELHRATDVTVNADALTTFSTGQRLDIGFAVLALRGSG